MTERFFWPAETRKNLNFLSCIFEIHMVLKYCSDINEGFVIQLLVSYVVLLKIVASFGGMGVFISETSFWAEIFSYCSVMKRLYLESKTDLTRTGLFLEFSFRKCLIALISSTSYLHRLKSARIVQLFVSDDIECFRLLVSGIFCSVL